MLIRVNGKTIDNNNETTGTKRNSIFTARFCNLMDGAITGKRITQGEIAEYIGTSRQAVSQYCNGVSVPSYDSLVKIADFFGVTTDYLLGRTDTPSGKTSRDNDLGLPDRTIFEIRNMTDDKRQIIGDMISSRYFADLLCAIQENIKLTQAEINHIESILNKEIAFDDSVYTLTDSFLYSELIDRYPFLKNRLHLAIGESAIIKQREEINEAFSKIIEQITHWNKLQNRKKELRRTQREQEKSNTIMV